MIKHQLNAIDRSEQLEGMMHSKYDLLVIGGGITGSGIALDAASRGLKVALVEMGDFASGTSSSSTKLIHGGLRYLKQFEIALVRETGKERAVVHKLAPHLVSPEKMLLPLIKDGTYGKILTSMGLMVYDILAGVEKPDQRRMLDEEETLALEPLLRDDIVEGGGLYAEYRTDDSRLTIEVLKTAARHGADVINYVKATDFLYEEGKITGINCEDTLAGKTFTLRGDIVVSAAGPWVDELRGKNNSLSGRHLYLTKGVHIVFDHSRFPIKQAVYFDVPDGRMIFAIPRGEVTYVGTTDTPYEGDKSEVGTDLEDVDYLLEGVNNTFPTVKLTREDVISSWAGLRPLIYEEGKSASEISRKDEIFESDTGLISIAGGKLTGYRMMARRVVDKVTERLRKQYDRSYEPCTTEHIVLEGGSFSGAKEVASYTQELELHVMDKQLQAYRARYLVSNYGRRAEKILERMEEYESEDAEVALARAELWFCVHYEMVHSVLDFIDRRSGRLYFDIHSIEALIPTLVSDMSEYFDWPAEKMEEESRRLVDALHAVSHFE